MLSFRKRIMTSAAAIAFAEHLEKVKVHFDGNDGFDPEFGYWLGTQEQWETKYDDIPFAMMKTCKPDLLLRMKVKSLMRRYEENDPHDVRQNLPFKELIKRYPAWPADIPAYPPSRPLPSESKEDFAKRLQEVSKVILETRRQYDNKEFFKAKQFEQENLDCAFWKWGKGTERFLFCYKWESNIPRFVPMTAGPKEQAAVKHMIVAYKTTLKNQRDGGKYREWSLTAYEKEMNRRYDELQDGKKEEVEPPRKAQRLE